MNRLKIINHFISKGNYLSYLEIGCQNNKTFNAVECKNKVGIDPEKGGTIRIDSDSYFSKLNAEEKFDIIFIDGLHIKEQVIKDIENSLLHLNEGGTIIVHDLLPDNEIMQTVPRISKAWTGNVWEAWVSIRQNRGDLDMCVVNVDHGCGIIKKGKQTKLSKQINVNYKGFEKNKVKWMNIIDVEEFKEKF